MGRNDGDRDDANADAAESNADASADPTQEFVASTEPGDPLGPDEPDPAVEENHETSDADPQSGNETPEADPRPDETGTTRHTGGFGGTVDDDDVGVVRSFVGSVPAPALAIDPDTKAVHAANEQAASLLGRDRTTLTLMGLSDVEAPTTETGDPIDEAFASVIETGGPAAFEWGVRTGDGERRRLDARAHTTTIASREWLVVTLSDASARSRAERGARERLWTLDAVASTVPMSLFQCDSNGTLVRWNDRLTADTGYATGELSGRALPDLFDDDSRSAVADALAAVYAGSGRTECEASLLLRSGGRTPYRVTLGPVTDSDGSIIGVVGVGEDRTEASLREERLAVLTRVLRHNFRNELNVIMGFTEQAKREVDDSGTRAQLDRVVDTAGRLLHLGETSRKVERLLASRPTPGPIPLASVVSDGLDGVPHGLRDRADIDADVSPGITVSAVEQLSEAITELIDNAIRHNDTEHPRVHVSAAELPSESWVSLVVADDGPGIPPAERAVLTGEETPLDHASGLGLWYVNWVVTAAGGSLTITESKGGGTRIELSLRTPSAT
ncbi:MAG: PAS domain-containing sensor histidine kinase [Halorubrum sp.]